MKKIRFMFLIIMIMSILTSCSSKENSSNKISNSETDIKEINESNEINGEITLSPYVVVGVDVQIILKMDGTVAARGLNSHGELGNGERIDSDSWVQVKNLEDVVGIYAFSEFGYDYNKYTKHKYCYALTGDGRFYRWGGNILTPEEITTIPTIESIEQTCKDLLVITCQNGEKYLLSPYYSTGQGDGIISYNSLKDDEKLYTAGSDYVLVKKGGKEAIDIETYNVDGNINTFEERIEKVQNIDLQGKKVSQVQGDYIVCSDHTVLKMNFSEVDDSIITEDIGAFGVLQIDLDNTENFNNDIKGWNKYYLFENGEIHTHGDNEYGQLGDGTLKDYYDGYLTINDAFFKEFYFCDEDDFGMQRKFVIAMDSEYNIWAWGGKYGTSPKIIINNTDFTDSRD